MREIGHSVHTPNIINLWQTRAGLDNCYYHGLGQHTSGDCNALNNAIAAAATGTLPTAPFVPRPDTPSLRESPDSRGTACDVHCPHAPTHTTASTAFVARSELTTDIGLYATARHVH